MHISWSLDCIELNVHFSRQLLNQWTLDSSVSCFVLLFVYSQRVIASVIIIAFHCTDCCRFILHAKKTAFVVEHDFIMATYLADRVIMFEGKPSVETVANEYA